MTGRVMIVTGANSGIGYEIAKYLAEGGNDVILACRDRDKGESAVLKIKKELPNSLVHYMMLDLSSLSSVREFVKEFTRKKRRLSVLINNAAMALHPADPSRKTTNDGNEVTMAVNHLGPYLLTNLLLDYLINTAQIIGDSRIINVTCSLHDHENSFSSRNLAPLATDNFQLQRENTFSGQQAYKNSKLCNVLFTYALAEKLKGTGVTVNAVDPGFVPTSELNRNGSSVNRCLAVCCLHRLLRCTNMTRSVKDAAQQVTKLAISDKYEGESGKYYRDGVPDRSSIESYDKDLQRKVWKISSQLVNHRSSCVEDDLDDISLS